MNTPSLIKKSSEWQIFNNDDGDEFFCEKVQECIKFKQKRFQVFWSKKIILKREMKFVHLKKEIRKKSP